MIDATGPKIVARCDECGDEVEVPEDTFLDAVQWLRDEGWRFYKNGPEWCHECPTCRESNDT